VIRPFAGRSAAVTAVVAGVIAVGAGASGLLVSTTTAGPGSPTPSAIAPTPTGRVAAANGTGYRTPRPVALVIPAIGVDARLVDLGLTAAGTVQVPAEPATPGWYTGSPRPGAIGSSILLGHIDSLAGPAVFYRLGQLRPRERVYVRRADHTLAVFRVDSVRWYQKTHFPTAAVYGPTPDAELRLISCGGVFDPQLKSYLSNIVVYATAIT
jgi:hypothetical protein